MLQNEFFRSNRLDKKFLHVQNINSINLEKKNHASKILLQELNLLYVKTNLKTEGPYPLEETTKILSSIFKCQFFIFDGLHNSNKLIYMYPHNYSDDLIPIYLYQPNDCKTHLVFIRNLNFYFKANLKICFGCRKTFKTHNYNHLCPKKPTCFSCRRFFKTTTTYVNEKLNLNFCDKNMTLEQSFTCTCCNVTCYSQHCFRGHKLICSGVGNFGYKCLKCNKFTYRYNKLNTEDLKLSHVCGEFKPCPFCREPKTLDHLCTLKKEVWPKRKFKLAFMQMAHFYAFSADCLQCQKFRITNPTAFCEKHTLISSDEPNFAVIYHEEKFTGNFTKYELNWWNEQPSIDITPNVLNFSYCKNEEIIIEAPSKKKTEDFERNYATLKAKNCANLRDKMLQLILSNEWHDTTFICQDEDSLTYVSLYRT